MLMTAKLKLPRPSLALRVMAFRTAVVARLNLLNRFSGTSGYANANDFMNANALRINFIAPIHM